MIVDSRLFIRNQCAIKTVARKTDGRGGLALVTDLALGGVGLQCGLELETGQVLELCPVVDESQPTPIRFRVCWRAARTDGWAQLGLQFQGPLGDLLDSWLEPHFANLGLRQNQIFERRNFRRRPVDIAATVGLGKTRRVARVIDIGGGGLRLETSRPLPVAARLQLELDLPQTRMLVEGRLVEPPTPTQQVWRCSLRLEGQAPPELQRYLSGTRGSTK